MPVDNFIKFYKKMLIPKGYKVWKVFEVWL